MDGIASLTAAIHWLAKGGPLGDGPAPRLWSPGFQWSQRRAEWVPTPAGVLMRALPALMTMDHHDGF
eukprot:9934284-Alexandrium_andersonii.AAC.1